MGRRQTSLDFSAYKIGGTSVLANLRSFDAHAALTQVNTKSIANRFGKKKTTHRSNRFTARVMNPYAGDFATALDMQLFTIGGAALVGDVQSGKIKVTNVDKDGGGAADLDAWAQLTGTGYEISGELHVPTSSPTCALFNQAATTLVPANFHATVLITIGSNVFSCPMEVGSVMLKAQLEEMTVFSITMNERGTPTSPNDGSTMLGLALAASQSAAVLLYANTGVSILDDVAASAAGFACVICSAEVSWAKGQLVEETYEFAASGQIGAT